MGKGCCPNLVALLTQTDPIDPLIMRQFYDEFDQYLKHGGYLTAINDIARNGRIRPAT